MFQRAQLRFAFLILRGIQLTQIAKLDGSNGAGRSEKYVKKKCNHLELASYFYGSFDGQKLSLTDSPKALSVPVSGGSGYVA